MPISDTYKEWDGRSYDGLRLALDAPLGHPHLIDLEKYKATGQTRLTTELRFADGIVTLLYHLKNLLGFLRCPDEILFARDYTNFHVRLRLSNNCVAYTGALSGRHDVSIEFIIDRKTGIWVPCKMWGKPDDRNYLDASADPAFIEMSGSKAAHDMIEWLWENGFGGEVIVA